MLLLSTALDHVVDRGPGRWRSEEYLTTLLIRDHIINTVANTCTVQYNTLDTLYSSSSGSSTVEFEFKPWGGECVKRETTHPTNTTTHLVSSTFACTSMLC
jgi:hypothetical protein